MFALLRDQRKSAEFSADRDVSLHSPLFAEVPCHYPLPCLQLTGAQRRKEKWAHCTVFLADDLPAAWSTNQAGNMFMGRFCRVSVDAEIMAKLGDKKKKKGGKKEKINRKKKKGGGE